MSILNPFQLLELNVISAQDLSPVSRSMRTYAVAWVHPDRKLSTRVDTRGHNNPTWNDKFVFRVDEDFLQNDTSAVMIEIYALHWFKDIHVGTVRILVGNLIPNPLSRAASSSFGNNNRHHHYHHPQLGMRFVALQVRRASGRPQGILNIGVALLHSSMRSMPLYSQLSTSAVGYKELMGEEDPIHHHNSNNNNNSSLTNTIHVGLLSELRRTKSDVSSLMGSETRAKEFKGKPKKGKKSSSMVNESEASSLLRRRRHRKKGGSSLISSAVSRRTGKSNLGKPSSAVNYGSEVKVETTPRKGKSGKVSSLINGISEVVAVDPPKKEKTKNKSSLINGNSEVDVGIEYNRIPPKKKDIIKPILKPSPSFGRDAAAIINASPRAKPSPRFNLTERSAPRSGNHHGKSPFHSSKFHPTPTTYEYATPRKSPLMTRGPAFLTESELGPSPSEVAEAIAKQLAPAEETESSLLGGWSVDESMEGLRSKLERWRTELPPVYDRGEFSSVSESRHNRRHTDGGSGSGLFSCFSNICGVECSIVCGSGSGSVSKKSNSSGRLMRSPSADNLVYK
ncbi:uncharacterized protein LOC133816769 [Humulus lupulus]|uniref:uncharacterized protein LOC133816769 n=1 Tax=Humulus lupulus TaxID=3486 RepID=UPI002B4177AD|nr:uncharacterized protein LOC133816769 [Humulus lupulus]